MTHKIMTSLLLCLLSFGILQAQTVRPEAYSIVQDQKIEQLASLYHRLLVFDSYRSSTDVAPIDLRVGDAYLYMTKQQVYFTYKERNQSPVQQQYLIRNLSENGNRLILEVNNPNSSQAAGMFTFIRNDRQQLESVLFQRGDRARSLVFNLRPLSRQRIERDTAYFTDRSLLDASSTDNLWSETLRPYSLEKPTAGLFAFERIYAIDSLNIEFEEEMIQKGKRQKLRRRILLQFRPRRAGSLERANRIEEIAFVVRKIEEVRLENNDGGTFSGFEFQLKIEEEEPLLQFVASLYGVEADEAKRIISKVLDTRRLLLIPDANNHIQELRLLNMRFRLRDKNEQNLTR